MVAAYLAHRSSTLGRSGLRLVLAAVAHHHRRAGHPWSSADPTVATVMRGILRRQRIAVRPAAALGTAEVLRLLATCGEDRGDHKSLAGLRDRALLLTAFAGGIRTGQQNSQEQQYSRSVTIRFPVPTADTRKLIGAGRAAIDRIFKAGPRYAKAEVALLDLVPAGIVQTGLFDQGDSEKAARFMQTIDRLNRLHGRRTVFFASEGTRKDWAMKQERKTQSLTTQWTELLGVR